MSDYSRTYNFTVKDNLATGDVNKRIKGSEIDTEFNAIVTAIASKADSGTWTSVAYDVGNFDEQGGGTWTVDAGDQATYAYRISGTTMNVAFRITGTDISGTVTALLIAIPASRVSTKTMDGIAYVSEAGTDVDARCAVAAAGTNIAIVKRSGAAFATTSSDNLNAWGFITFEVDP